MKTLSGRIHPALSKLLALVLALCLLAGLSASAEEADHWVNFLLVCNEGMNNSGGNAGNTLMVVAMNPEKGIIRLGVFTWDTFVDYEGYDLPQKLDMPYRNNGPEETLKVFKQNFALDIDLFMSLNYLNLASLVDSYGGVTVDISRAERNALNGMVASKKQSIQKQADSGLLSQVVVELLADEYYLNDYGPETHLNGLQAVGFGWLQYDSVYNCCEREVEVIASLFNSVAKTIGQKLALYTDATGYPEDVAGRTAINLDHITDEDMHFLRLQMAPIFEMSYNNLSDEDIEGITRALINVAYLASRQGVDIFEHVDTKVFPLEAQNPYDMVAGAQGHLVDNAANTAAMQEFLFAEKD